MAKIEITKTCYSDEELAEFKILIENKIQQNQTDLRSLQEEYAKSSENGTRDTSSPLLKYEEAGDSFARENLAFKINRIKNFLEKLSAALRRIENKTYGICRITGKLIPKDRLMSVPHATTTIEGKEKEHEQELLESIPKGYYNLKI